MPTYDYQCRACGTTTEVIHSMLDDGPSVCELCGGTLRRVIFPSGIIFKGSGFYRNDSRASAAEASGSSGGSTKSEPESGGASTKTAPDASGTDAKAGSGDSSNKAKPAGAT